MSDKITIQDGIKDDLTAFAKEKGVSVQGMITGFCLIVLGKTDELGYAEINWKRMKRRYPSIYMRNDKRWAKVVKGVKTILDDMGIEDLNSLDGRDLEVIASRSRYTYAQVKQAIVTISEEL